MDGDFTLKQEHIILNLQSDDRFSAFEEMVSHLVTTGAIPFSKQQEILTTLSEREEQTTFAVGRNIAIPHINGTDVAQCIFLYARSVDGIEFGSCDTGLVHHLFLALIPEQKKCGWLKSLAHMAKTLSCAELREELMNLADAPTARALLDAKLSNVA